MEPEKAAYKRLCCEKTFTSRQSFYQHRRLVHSIEHKERQEEKLKKRFNRQLQEKERLEEAIKMAEKEGKNKDAVTTILHIVKQHKAGNTVSLN